MRRLVFGFFISLSTILIATSNPATADIPLKHRVRNRTGIQCVWASIECLARKHGIEEASHLTDRYKSYSDPARASAVLDGLKIKYKMITNKNKQFLIDACEKDWDAAVAFNYGHMVNLAGWRNGKVYIIDNLDPNLSVQEWTEEKFMRLWDGWAITLVPPTVGKDVKKAEVKAIDWGI